MTTRTRLALLMAGAFAVGLLSGYLVPKPPRTQADCLLRYIKPGMSNTGAAMVYRSCKEKFPT